MEYINCNKYAAIIGCIAILISLIVINGSHHSNSFMDSHEVLVKEVITVERMIGND